MRLSILMPAMVRRRQRRAPIECCLRAQIGSHTDVELLIDEDDGETPSGRKRNRLMEQAKGEYVCFVDDDDMVSTRYVAAILGGLRTGPDVVTFWMRRTGDDRGPDIHMFGLRHPDGNRVGPSRVKMTANHLCVWRRSIAASVPFPNHLGYADDVFWYRPLVASWLAETEVHLSEVLYHYQWSSQATGNQSRDRLRATRQWCGAGIEAFLMDGRVYVATVSRDRLRRRRPVPCYSAGTDAITMIDRRCARKLCEVRV